MDLDDLDEYSEADVFSGTEFHFELMEDLTLIYDKEEDIWYVENEAPEEEDLILMESFEEGISFEDIDVWGYPLTKEEFEEYKNVVAKNS